MEPNMRSQQSDPAEILTPLRFYACSSCKQVWRRSDWKWTSFFSTTQGHVTPKWLIRSGRNSNLSKILCLSSLPVSLMEIEFGVTDKRWIHPFFSSNKSMGKKISTHGRITPKWIKSDLAQIQTHSELLCLSLLPASLTNISSKVTEKS